MARKLQSDKWLFLATLALVCVSGLAILVGGTLGHYLPLLWIKRAAAVMFIFIGVMILLGKF